MHALPPSARGRIRAARLSHAAIEWGLRALGLESMSLAQVATALGISWHAANSAILTRVEQVLNEAPDQVEGAHMIGVESVFDGLCKSLWKG